MSAYMKKRLTAPDAKGKRHARYLVYYRRGGRAFPELYAGSFSSQKEAQARIDMIRGELAVGRDPATMLAELRKPTAKRRTMTGAFTDFRQSRIDVKKATQDLYRNSEEKIVPILGADTDPYGLRVPDIQLLVNALAEELAPASVHQYVSTLRQVLDYVLPEGQPNPCRSPKLRFPVDAKEEVSPPSTAEWRAVLAALARRYRLFARLLECEGMRIGEGLALTWGDIDWTTSRVRVSRARTKTRSGQRWLPVPEELLDDMAMLLPEEDRDLSGRVFSDVSDSGFRNAMRRAVKTAGVAHFHPHDLRHRRISLWFAHGVDEIRVSSWAGHANASMSQDVYGHVLIDASDDEWRRFWLEEYRGRREAARV